MQLHTIDFEDIYMEQSWFQIQKNEIQKTEIILPDGTNGYCSEDTYKIMQAYSTNILMPSLTFLGSGNYHYLTYFLIQQIEEPYTLVLFDYHSDIQLGMCKELLSCGNWVHFALKECDNLKQVFIVGVAKQYIPKDFNDYGKEVYFIAEDEIHSTDWIGKMLSMIQYPVYISIDKDVFVQNTVYTNWDQGSMKINDIKEFFEKVGRRHKVFGGDICGECDKNYADVRYGLYQEVNGDVNRRLMGWFM